MARFGRRDVRDALALVYLASSVNGTGPFPEPVLQALATLVPSDTVGYNEREIRSHRLLAGAETPSVVPPEAVAEAVATFCGEYPLSIERRSSEMRALMISDFASSRELHRLDYYDQVLRPLGIEYQLRLWLSSPPGVARYFYANRSRARGEFGERDRDLLELLRPFLIALRGRFEPHVSRVESNGDGLTGREAEILTWVARGKTNKEIATLLFVSPHTVRRHLENVYAKLGVHTRTAAVARATARPT
jgi:DNA-binding CsgD family transcriptional regulator